MGLSVKAHSQMQFNQIKNDTSGKVAIAEQEEGTWFSRTLRDFELEDVADWLEDKDKICTDKRDDGNIGFTEAAKSFGKGLISIVKVGLNNPITTLGSLALGVGATVLSGGALLPAFIAMGAAVGTGMVGYGAYKVATAETDAEAKRAWETIGEGAFALGSSAMGAKASLNSAAKSGVVSAMGTEDFSTAKAVVQCFKATPEALKVSAKNAVHNAKVLIGAASPIQLTASEKFAQEKMMLQKRIENNVAITESLDEGNLVGVKASEVESKIFKYVTEDNFELAKALMTPDESIANHFKSSYLQSREAVSEYYFRTVPRLLQADPEVQQVALKLLKEDNIGFRFDVLKVLNKNNCSDIASMTSDVYLSTEQVSLVKSFSECYSETKGNFLKALGEYAKNLEYIGKDSKVIQVVQKTRSLESQILEKYPIIYKREEMLPYVCDGSPFYGKQFNTKVFTPANYVPKTGVTNYAIDNTHGYTRYVLFDDVTSPKNSIFKVQDMCRELLNRDFIKVETNVTP